jgi:NhaA family Na+:H+ antiporter
VTRDHRPGTDQPLIRPIIEPFQSFIHTESAGGILLLAAAITAMAWANSPWAEAYAAFRRLPVTVGAGDFVLTAPLVLWINDGLMAMFFFVVGLEIKREVLVGELSSLRRAALPLAAAVGGSVAPALVYVALNAGTEGASGWGIPMATDIAFSLGILSLLGKRVPLALKVFWVALASWLAVRIGAATLPAELTWRHLIGTGFLAAIGFTMSLFIEGLAFGKTPLDAPAKVGILAGAAVAGLAGRVILRTIEPSPAGRAASESSTGLIEEGNYG